MERALQHIREAEELTKELGGTDKDVKEYFFQLSHAELTRVLQLYGQRHGEKARQYAEETIPRWRSGSVKMAGQTAARLFDLLPPLMPLSEKYRLAENLWRHVGPSSKRRLRVGLDASAEDAIAMARDHIEGVVSSYVIPDSLSRRFNWLAAGDVGVKQQILNHLQSLEKKLVVEDVRQHLPVMLDHLRKDVSQTTARLARILKIGKHELEILVDRNIRGTGLEDWKPERAPTSSGSSGWIWVVVGLIAAALFFALRKKMGW
jgi:hypothetical protein